VARSPCSNARRKLFGANGGPCRAEPSTDIAANRARIGTKQPTRAGRSGRGAVATVLLGNRKLVTKCEACNIGQHGYENWRLPKRKGDEKRAHHSSDHDCTNDRNLYIFRSDGVFGKDRRSFQAATACYRSIPKGIRLQEKGRKPRRSVCARRDSVSARKPRKLRPNLLWLWSVSLP
jgi:hypothetical protein